MALPHRLSTGMSYTPVGTMNSQINILRSSKKRDANGEFLSTEELFAGPFWARVQFVADTVKEKSEQVVTEATHKIIMRYYGGIDSSMTVQDVSVQGQTKIYNISGSPVDPDGRQFEMWLFCYERDDGRSGVQQ